MKAKAKVIFLYCRCGYYYYQ